jgi:MFS transporter, DHA1 family, multidrug resistance protein
LEPTIKSAPSTRQSWVLLTALFTLANLLEIVLFSNLSAFTPLFLQNIGYDEAGVKLWTGILASAGIALGFWFVPFWGVLADRHGRKPLIIRSYVVEAVAVMLMAFSNNVWLFLLGRTMTGLALGNTGLMYATLTDQAPRERVGFAISIITGSTPVGVVVGSLLGGFVVAHFGVNVLFGVLAVMISLVVLMLALLYHEAFVPGTIYPLMRMLRTALRAVATTPVVVTLFTFSFIVTFGYFFSFPFVPNRIVELVGQANSGGTIGLVFGLAGIATVFATPLWGLAADRFGHRRLLPVVTLLTAVLFLPLYWAADVVQFTWRLFFLYGVQPAVNSLTFATIGLETPPEKRSAVLSMIYMPLNAAILFAPSLAVVLTPEIRDVFLYSAFFTFIAFLMLAVTNRLMAPASTAAAE